VTIDAYPLVVMSPVFGLGVYCFAHVLLSRLRIGKTPYVSLIAGFFIGSAADLSVSILAAMNLRVPSMDAFGWCLLSSLTYVALGWCYFHFVNLGIASLRIRVLEEIVEAGGTLQAVSLQDRYNDARMADARIQRLIAGGHLVARGERFHRGSARFLFTARLFAVLRHLIIGNRTP
jgi:hypothetical protein